MNPSTTTFQFTRPRGGAISSPYLAHFNHSFNSHAPVGARFVNLIAPDLTPVSIHTPPWGRDYYSYLYCEKCWFQFTRPRGGAIHSSDYEHRISGFQFTRPRGGAMRQSRRTRRARCFNSHAPVGARLHLGRRKFAIVRFNSHAPVGARCQTFR